MAKQYGRRKNGSMRRDNPHIRRKHGEARDVALGEDYEVDYARQHRQIRVKGKVVHPVPGKTHIRNGRLLRDK